MPPVNPSTVTARSLLAAGKVAEAIAELEQLSRLSPDDDGVWAALAEAHLADGAPDLAVQAAQRAVDVMPVSVPAWTVMADAFALAGLWEEALTAAVQQFELYPVVPDGLYKAAVAHVHLDDPLGAIRALEAALSQRRSLRETLRVDARFDPIRDHDGFRLLLS